MPAVARGQQQHSVSMSADRQPSDSDKEASGSSWLRYTRLLRQRTGRAVSHPRSLLLPAAAVAALLLLILLASSQSPLGPQLTSGGSGGLPARHSPARSSSLRDFLTDSSSDSSAVEGVDEAAADISPPPPPLPSRAPLQPPPASDSLPAAAAGQLPLAESAASGEYFWTEAVLSLAEEQRPSPLSSHSQAGPRCLLTRFNILGERCSGTNALQKLLQANFQLDVTQEFHHKHFFGFPDPAHPLSSADCVLFVGSVRHPVDWLSSFYHNLWQLDQWRFTSWTAFLTLPIVSYAEPKMNKTLERYSPAHRHEKRQEMLRREIKKDRNPQAPDRHWQDVFELRRVKLLYMLDSFPQLVRNYVLVRTEDLVTHSAAFLDLLEARFNLSRRRPARDVVVRSHRHTLPADVESYVMQHLDIQVEQRFGYLL